MWRVRADLQVGLRHVRPFGNAVFDFVDLDVNEAGMRLSSRITSWNEVGERLKSRVTSWSGKICTASIDSRFGHLSRA